MRTRLPALLALLRRRSVARTGAWIVTLAILAQGWLAAPLALRMAMGEVAAAPAEAAAASCHGGEGASPSASHHEHHGGKRADHDHQRCLICKAGAGPLVALAISGIALRIPADRPDGGAAPHPLAIQALAAQYRSRAPPATA